MKKKILMTLSYILVAAISAGAALYFRGYSKLELIEDIIANYYIEDVDFSRLEDYAADAMAYAVGDQWTMYIPAAEMGDYVDDTNNSYAGIGVTVEQLEENQGFLVDSVVPGGPAEEAGVVPGDVVIEVAEQDVRQMNMDGLSGLIRGETDTAVTLAVLRKGERVSMTVTRRVVAVPAVNAKLLEGNIGCVQIVNFESRAAQETIAAIEDLRAQGADKLIFDVRGNPGGFDSELTKLLDYLLPEGLLIRMVDYSGKVHEIHSDAANVALPMVVLINEDSYSAAEFFAAALRDYHRGILVGTATSGKGRYQTDFDLGDGSALHLSVGRYYTPAGENLEGVGLTPDLEVPVDEEAYYNIYRNRLTPEEDPQLQKAVEYLLRGEA